MKGYVNLPWGQVHFRSAPAEARLPAMFLLHQSPLSSRNYAALLPFLASHCRPYALDTPGYGASSAVPEHWEVADYAAAVWDCADRLGVRDIILFGRASGAVFALEAALSRPERVRCLILHGLPVYTDAERADRMANFAPPLEPRVEGGHLAAIWQRIKGEYPWIGPELATHFVHDFLGAGADFARSYRAIWRYDLRSRLRSAPEVPTLLIGGTADRIAFMHERAVKLLPAAQALVLEGATDFVAEQEPARLARVLIEFFSKLVPGKLP